MEEIEKRLRESTDACIKSFESWVKAGKNLETRETLMEAMHEVRKVVSRVEIEIAISERDRLGSRPIPIPPHRSSSKGRGASSDDGDFSEDDFAGNEQQPSSNAGAGEQQQPRRQHNNRPGGRRPMPNRGGNGGNNTGGDSQPS